MDLKETGCNSVDWITLVRLGHSGSKKHSLEGAEFLYQLSNCELLKKASAPWGKLAK
jgi:hypothetical protein